MTYDEHTAQCQRCKDVDGSERIAFAVRYGRPPHDGKTRCETGKILLRALRKELRKTNA